MLSRDRTLLARPGCWGSAMMLFEDRQIPLRERHAEVQVKAGSHNQERRASPPIPQLMAVPSQAPPLDDYSVITRQPRRGKHRTF